MGSVCPWTFRGSNKKKMDEMGDNVFKLAHWSAERAYDIDAICKSFPQYEEMLKAPTDTYEQVRAYERLFAAYRAFVIAKIPHGARFRELFGDKRRIEIKSLRRKLLCESDVRAKRYYEDILVCTQDERVNGYCMYSKNELEFSIEFEDFLKLCEIWDDVGNDMDDAEFAQWLEDNCCTDWNKQDRHGKSYGGFWRYPEDSYEREHAYELSRADNLKGMCELPYPRRILIDTVQWGCNTRMESVRFSNFCCEWIKRKREHLFPSLKTLAERAMKEQ